MGRTPRPLSIATPSTVAVEALTAVIASRPQHLVRVLVGRRPSGIAITPAKVVNAVDHGNVTAKDPRVASREFVRSAERR
jgi:hypothetical protein